MLDGLGQFTDSNKLKVNTRKTKVLVVGGRRPVDVVTYKGEVIEQVDKFTYLGM